MIRANSAITSRASVRSTSQGRWWALSALAVSLLVVGLDTTVVLTALPTLSAKLDASTSQLQWVMNAYTLVLAGLIIPAGVLGDRLGRRRLLLFGLLLFGIASAVASQVTSPGELITLRAITGVGGAAIVPLAFAILPSLFSDKERPRAISVLATAVFIGLPLGPLVAGWLLTNYAWGSIFLINVPIVAIALLGVWLFVPESKDPRPVRLDWLGVALSVAGVTALIYGIVEQPIYGWGGTRVLAGIIIGLLLLAAFVVQQLRTRAPLVNLGLFGNARFRWSTLAFVVVGFALGGILFVLTPFLQLVQGNDAQATGIRLLPLILGIAIGAMPSDRLTARVGSKIMVAGGMLVTAVGTLLFSRVATDSGFAFIAVAELLTGVGLGLALPPALDAILGVLPKAETGRGMALTRALQFIGMSFGVAVLGSILNSAYRDSLNGHLTNLPAAAQAAAEQSLAGAASVPYVFGAARIAYVSGMSDVMLTSAAILAAAAVLIALYLPARPEDRKTALKKNYRA